MAEFFLMPQASPTMTVGVIASTCRSVRLLSFC